jgi:hypothetical protein
VVYAQYETSVIGSMNQKSKLELRLKCYIE